MTFDSGLFAVRFEGRCIGLVGRCRDRRRDARIELNLIDRRLVHDNRNWNLVSRVSRVVRRIDSPEPDMYICIYV